MKPILVVCAVFFVYPLLTDGYYTKGNSMIPLSDYSVTNEQINCIKSRVGMIIADRKDFQQWLNEVASTALKLFKGIPRCEGISSPKQTMCFSTLQSTSLVELGRVIDLMTKDMVDTFDSIADTVVECLLTGNADLFSRNLSTNDLQITDDEIKCIINVISILVKHNRDAMWWIEDVGKALLSLAVEARECPLQSVPDRTLCIVKLKIHVSAEILRLYELLPPEKLATASAIRGFFHGCFLW